MRADLFDYVLPEELIAQYPCPERTGSRLMCVDRAAGTLEHKMFSDIADRLKANDILILNDTKVIPARLFGEKVATKAAIEILLLDEVFTVPYDKYVSDHGAPAFGTASLVEAARWRALIYPSRRMHTGETVVFRTENDTQRFFGTIPAADEKEPGMERVIDLFSTRSVKKDIERYGAVPLPPYIRRAAEARDKETYQTVFAAKEGAIAAPTAGLHFDQPLLERLRAQKVTIEHITLHVSYGTFQPVKVENIREHVMHIERFEVPERTAAAVNAAKAEGRRVIACGTTTVRALESAVDVGNFVTPGARQTNLFIYPSFEFKIVDALITNFHLPKSSLFMLVCAFSGREFMQRAYQEAVARRYRFFSYGDAMFIT